MREISLNIMDIVQNSIVSGASLINISITENTKKNIFKVIIKDNGKGMTPEQVNKATDPFYTTRKTRKVGLGLPLFKMAAEYTGGNLKINSKEGIGTEVCVKFVTTSINMIPLGNINSTVGLLIKCNLGIDFVYRREIDEKFFILDTREIKKILEDEALISSKDVTDWIDNYLKEQTQIIRG